MDLTEVKRFEQVGTLKLSQAIRTHGYGCRASYNDCVLARAYRARTGRELIRDVQYRDATSYVAHVAREFGVPYRVAQECELQCFRGRSSEFIANYAESQGY